MKAAVAFCTLALGLYISPASAERIRPDHPLIGTWQVDIPELRCHEVYRIRNNGTTLVTSAEEVSESSFTVSDQPSDKGFYKWVDTITKDNGKPDCGGSVMTVGHTATNYVVFHPSGEQFLLCEDESLATCFGPFIRVHEKSI